MVLQNHSLNQDKLFQKLLKFRTWLCLPRTLHQWFTSDIYIGYFKIWLDMDMAGNVLR